MSPVSGNITGNVIRQTNLVQPFALGSGLINAFVIKSMAKLPYQLMDRRSEIYGDQTEETWRQKYETWRSVREARPAAIARDINAILKVYREDLKNDLHPEWSRYSRFIPRLGNADSSKTVYLWFLGALAAFSPNDSRTCLTPGGDYDKFLVPLSFGNFGDVKNNVAEHRRLSVELADQDF